MCLVAGKVDPKRKPSSSCTLPVIGPMEAQDFGDFFEHINPDAPEFLSMPSYCDLLG